MSKKKENALWLEGIAKDEGVSLFGVCEIDPFRDRFLFTPDEFEGHQYGVVVGVALSPAVLRGIVDQPTLVYKWHYRQANNLLDRIAFTLTQEIMKAGWRALPIPASQIVDWEKQKGHVSHRLLGEAAGLGWRGRNNLLVNETYGSQFRLVSVITDMPLEPSRPAEPGCGSCRRCVSLCPAGAFGKEPADYDLDKCYAQLQVFSKIRGIGQHICGICVKACPGKDYG